MKTWKRQEACQTSAGITRRRFLHGMGLGAGVLMAPGLVRGVHADAYHQDSELFPLGVFSGDPDAHSVVIGTRLAPEPLHGGGLRRPVVVRWEVASDPGMTGVVRSGVATAWPHHGHAVQVLVSGLRADSWYYYRFHARGESSRIGRTRTFPGRHAAWQQMRFGLASCQDYRAGFYAAYADMAQQDVDFVVHVGDYIYEDGSSPQDLRPHTVGSGPGGEIVTVEDYRNRYAQYRLDDSLKAAHAAFPFIVTWDDHEVDNNYAGEIAEVGAPAQGVAFLARRQAALQVYGEMMPLRRANHDDGRVRVERTLRYGALATIHVLDTRLFRTDQPCGDRFGPACGEELDPQATLLGDRQEARLFRALRHAHTTWNILAQQVMLTRWDLGRLLGSAPVPGINFDAWDGYQAARQRLVDVLAVQHPANPVVLTGDIHASFAADILQNFADPSTVVAAELVGTSISSAFIDDPALRIAIKNVTLSANPHIKFHEGALRGYVLCEVNAHEWVTTYKGVRDVTDPQSPVIDVARARIVAGTPGIAGSPVIFADPDQGIFPAS